MLFDLDGTLVDSVYQHVLAWRDALEGEGFHLSVWRIHRRIGMSGGLFLRALVRELGHNLTDEQAGVLRESHASAFLKRMDQVRPLTGARELLSDPTSLTVPWAIAISASTQTAAGALPILGPSAGTPAITRAQTAYA